MPMPADRKFDLVILDFDGTLSNTRLAIAHCLQCAFAVSGRPIADPARIMPIVQKGLPLRQTVLLLDPSLAWNAGALEEIVSTYRRLYHKEGEWLVDAFPEAEFALRQLHHGGVRCVVVSNKGLQAIERSLQRHGLRPFVDAVFAEQPETPRKPDGAVMSVCIQPHFPGVASDRMLMVGDTELDIEFAKNCGIACCWAAYGFGDRQRCLALGPEYLIEHIAELPGLVAESMFHQPPIKTFDTEPSQRSP
jgi:phosphoglycolate phosphatase